MRASCRCHGLRGASRGQVRIPGGDEIQTDFQALVRLSVGPIGCRGSKACSRIMAGWPGRRRRTRSFCRRASQFSGRSIQARRAMEWCESIARGLFRSAHPRVYPAVYVSDNQVITSVAERALTCRVWITNSSNQTRTLDLASSLSSWNRASRKPPAILCWPSTELGPRTRRGLASTSAHGVFGSDRGLVPAGR